jgi:hypothetical protein
MGDAPSNINASNHGTTVTASLATRSTKVSCRSIRLATNRGEKP